MIPADAAGDPRLERLYAFETRHRLFEQKCDDWSIWRVLRRVVHRELTTQDQPDTGPAPAASRFRGVPRLVAQLAMRMIAPPRADLLLMTATSALRDESEAGYRDIYFDDLLDTGLTAFKIEVRNSGAFNARSASAARPAQANLLAVDFLARMLSRLRPLPKEVQAFSAELSERLHAELGVALPARWILRTIGATHEQARIYEQILRRVRPKAVLVVDTAEFPMLIACRGAGVPLIEMQHGVFTAEHPEAVPALPGLDQGPLLLPDRLAAFGNYWKRELAGTAMPADRIVPVGNVLIDRMRALRAMREPSDELRILVTSQGIATSDLVAWLDGFAAAAPPAMRWKLHVKLHPIYEPSTAPYQALARHNEIEIIPGDRSPLTVDLLANADLHLSISSTSHFDAISIGVPTVIIPLPSHEIIRFVADDRSAFVARDPADIWRIVRSVPSVPDEGHDFCAPNYVKNLRSLIDAL